MDLYGLLDDDPNSPENQLARALVEVDDQLIIELVTLRESKGLTQKDVAQLIGTTQGSISRFESGQSDVHLSTVRRYAQAIGVLIKHQVIPFTATESSPDLPPYEWEKRTVITPARSKD
ncbi:helix-turn-helix transcriptional regulator [Schaalia sp. ZJ1691]|uniref:helix-turn-helix domain-containing protein n=1 Tax=Schaalia sp. ZJ1691 TaxID=2709404 RepID=UPI0013EC458A|nr:helix-turn-helix transcriptional regulator [Schaalia sp. ZJ1691]